MKTSLAVFFFTIVVFLMASPSSGSISTEKHGVVEKDTVFRIILYYCTTHGKSTPSVKLLRVRGYGDLVIPFTDAQIVYDIDENVEEKIFDYVSRNDGCYPVAISGPYEKICPLFANEDIEFPRLPQYEFCPSF